MEGSKSRASVKEGRWGKGGKHCWAGAEQTKDLFKYIVFFNSISLVIRTEEVNAFKQETTATGWLQLEPIATSGEALADISENKWSINSEHIKSGTVLEGLFDYFLEEAMVLEGDELVVIMF